MSKNLNVITYTCLVNSFDQTHREHVTYSENVSIVSSQFIECSDDYQGGAIYSKNSIIVSINKCFFTQNSCLDRGGSIALYVKRSDINNSCFYNNSAEMNTDFQCTNDLVIVNQVSSSKGVAKQHALWNKGGIFITDFNISNNIMGRRGCYGSVMTVAPTSKGLIKYIQSFNTKGPEALFTAECLYTNEISAYLEHAKFINDTSSTYIFGTMNNSLPHYVSDVYMAYLTNISRAFGSSSNVGSYILTNCYSDLCPSFFNYRITLVECTLGTKCYNNYLICDCYYNSGFYYPSLIKSITNCINVVILL